LKLANRVNYVTISTPQVQPLSHHAGCSLTYWQTILCNWPHVQKIIHTLFIWRLINRAKVVPRHTNKIKNRPFKIVFKLSVPISIEQINKCKCQRFFLAHKNTVSFYHNIPFGKAEKLLFLLVFFTVCCMWKSQSYRLRQKINYLQSIKLRAHFPTKDFCFAVPESANLCVTGMLARG
jgi:hypothetical protein